ncbi:MAG: hypothetical protein IT373_03930 [Polyangiaceae bacterium]|nr:hypothetical protein [Polyangiaceae bacterium]
MTESGDESEPAAPSSPHKPLLASQALIEDLAPEEPLKRGARWWCLGVGAAVAPLGAQPFVEDGTPSASGIVTLCYGATALLAGALPLGYRLRAAVMLGLAVLGALLGTLRLGPAQALGDAAAGWGVLHAIAGVALPGALLFRARYRAYGHARRILAVGLALAGPFAVYMAVTIAKADDSATRIAAVVALLAVGVSLLGFMGSETTGAGSYLAAAVIAAITATLTAPLAVALLTKASELEAEAPPTADLWPLYSTLAFGATLVLGALGACQLLAARLWRDARIIDLHAATKGDRPSMGSLPDWPSSRR